MAGLGSQCGYKGSIYQGFESPLLDLNSRCGEVGVLAAFGKQRSLVRVQPLRLKFLGVEKLEFSLVLDTRGRRFESYHPDK